MEQGTWNNKINMLKQACPSAMMTHFRIPKVWIKSEFHLWQSIKLNSFKSECGVKHLAELEIKSLVTDKFPGIKPLVLDKFPSWLGQKFLTAIHWECNNTLV